MPSLARHEPSGRAVDSSPSRYIARVDRGTGRELDVLIRPHELLVHAHRDHHPVDVAVQFLASRLVELTGRDWLAREGMRRLNRLGGGVAHALGALLHDPEMERRARDILGVVGESSFFRFREASTLTEGEARSRVATLREGARAGLAHLGPRPRLRVLLTGATGFLGKEVLVQAAGDPHVAEVVCLLRPERIGNAPTGRAARVARREGAGRASSPPAGDPRCGGAPRPLRGGRHRACPPRASARRRSLACDAP